MFGNSIYAYLLESILVVIPMALIIFLVLRYVWSRNDLKVEVNPNTGQLGPPNLCRGGWNEAELRGCQHGYGTTGMPVEPVNTYSNLAYLAAGWVALRSVGGVLRQGGFQRAAHAVRLVDARRCFRRDRGR